MQEKNTSAKTKQTQLKKFDFLNFAK